LLQQKSSCCCVYFRAVKRELCVAPMPGLPCFTGLYQMENSAGSGQPSRG
jgi:hypothetical protein